MTMDDIDISTDKAQTLLDAYIESQRQRAAAIPPGEPGECDWCGEYKPRLVNGACGRCRDERRLP